MTCRNCACVRYHTLNYLSIWFYFWVLRIFINYAKTKGVFSLGKTKYCMIRLLVHFLYCRALLGDCVSLETSRNSFKSPLLNCSDLADWPSDWSSHSCCYAIDLCWRITSLFGKRMAKRNLSPRLFCPVFWPHVCHTLANDRCLIHCYCSETQPSSQRNIWQWRISNS